MVLKCHHLLIKQEEQIVEYHYQPFKLHWICICVQQLCVTCLSWTFDLSLVYLQHVKHAKPPRVRGLGLVEPPTQGTRVQSPAHLTKLTK